MNVIDANGLQTATQAELIAILTASYQSIYGADVNLSQDTPDGQMMMIWIQIILDVLDLVKQSNSSFDPDQAIGVLLDQRVAINGIERKGGTYSVTPATVSISYSSPVNLYGLDQTLEPVYSISDKAGFVWYLMSTQIGLTSADHVLNFRASVPGAITTIKNTITTPVTIVLGVSAVSNPSDLTTLGVDEESDYILKIRRQKSVSLSSQGYRAGLKAALENITGVSYAEVYENNTKTTDIYGQPGNSIWVVVSGSGQAADIAKAIYQKRNAGCGMFGAIDQTVIEPDGKLFITSWDKVIQQDLFIAFTVTSLDGINAPNEALIRTQLPILLTPSVYQKININDIATLVKQIDNNALVTGAGLSLAATGPFTSTLIPSAKTNQFRVTSPNIIILPIQLTPAAAQILNSGDTRQFIASGGFGAYVWTIPVSNSGATSPVGGFYTAGVTPGIDTVRVTDSQGNYKENTIQVV